MWLRLLCSQIDFLFFMQFVLVSSLLRFTLTYAGIQRKVWCQKHSLRLLSFYMFLTNAYLYSVFRGKQKQIWLNFRGVCCFWLVIVFACSLTTAASGAYFKSLTATKKVRYLLKFTHTGLTRLPGPFDEKKEYLFGKGNDKSVEGNLSTSSRLPIGVAEYMYLERLNTYEPLNAFNYFLNGKESAMVTCLPQVPKVRTELHRRNRRAASWF